MSIRREQLMYCVLVCAYLALCINVGTLVCAVCRGYYVLAWHTIMTRSKYRLYLRSLQQRTITEPCTVAESEPTDLALAEKSEPRELFHKVAITLTKKAPKSRAKKQRKQWKTAHWASPCVSSDGFCWPLQPGNFWVSSHFGPRLRGDGSAGFHYGVDLAAQRGRPIVAARSGVVRYAGYMRGYGNLVTIDHDDGHFETRYAHLDTISVSQGQRVAQGVIIGAVGSTGHVRGESADASHLHFELCHYHKRVNPMQFLPKL